MKKQKKKVSMGDLAGMVQRGFVSVDERFNKVDKAFEVNTREHEAISLRLDNVAYRFELVELQKRVDFLEKKTGIKK